MVRDPYWQQRRTKSENREKILDLLRNKPSTFGELLEGTRLSRPVLSSYLKELKRDQIVTRRISGDRTEYELTQIGKTTALLRTSVLTAGLHAAGELIRDPQSADLFSNMGKMAKEKPEMFQTMMNWLLDLELLITSDGAFESRWLRILAGDKEEVRPINEAIRKKLSQSPIQPKTPEELRTVLDGILGTVKEVLTTEKSGRKKA